MIGNTSVDNKSPMVVEDMLRLIYARDVIIRLGITNAHVVTHYIGPAIIITFLVYNYIPSMQALMSLTMKAEYYYIHV